MKFLYFFYNRRAAEGNAEVVSIASSTELFELDKDGDKQTAGKQKDDEKKGQSAADQLDLQIEESKKQLEQMILDGEVLV